MKNLDYKWFVENLDNLYKEYGDVYLAIKEKKVIGVFSSYAEGVKEMSKKEELGTFIIQKCGKDKSAYTNYISSFNFILA